MKFLNSTPTFFFSYRDKDGKYLLINKQYEKVLNLPYKKILGKTIQNLIGSENYNISVPFLNQALNGQEVIFSYPWRYNKHKCAIMEVHYIPDFDKSGKVVKGIY